MSNDLTPVYCEIDTGSFPDLKEFTDQMAFPDGKGGSYVKRTVFKAGEPPQPVSLREYWHWFGNFDGLSEHEANQLKMRAMYRRPDIYEIEAANGAKVIPPATEYKPVLRITAAPPEPEPEPKVGDAEVQRKAFEQFGVMALKALVRDRAKKEGHESLGEKTFSKQQCIDYLIDGTLPGHNR